MGRSGDTSGTRNTSGWSELGESAPEVVKTTQPVSLRLHILEKRAFVHHKEKPWPTQA
jgi:hypothetical protein